MSNVPMPYGAEMVGLILWCVSTVAAGITLAIGLFRKRAVSRVTCALPLIGLALVIALVRPDLSAARVFYGIPLALSVGALCLANMRQPRG